MPSQSAALSLYRAEINRSAPLSPAAERELADRCRGGDRDAARRLIEGCLSTVAAIAYEYRRCGLPMEDLVQEGNIGLMKAVERFDPAHGTRLSRYAAYWVRAEIRAYVVRHYRIVKLGSTKGEQRAVWLYRRTREPSAEKLAEQSGLTLERATSLLPLLQANDVSLSPRPEDEGPSLFDRLAHRGGTAEEAVGDEQEREMLRAAIDRVVDDLPPRDQDIVRRRLLADEPATLEALGTAWGVSKERMRQLEVRVKAQLRACLEGVLGDDVRA